MMRLGSADITALWFVKAWGADDVQFTISSANANLVSMMFADPMDVQKDTFLNVYRLQIVFSKH